MKLRFFALILSLTGALAACTSSPPDAPEPEVPPGLENGSFTAELNGFSIHYEVHGQGPVLMTVPNSWGLTLQGLRGLYRRLEDHLTLVYFDPRGMGLSDPIREEADMGKAAVRADFDALRLHLGLDRINAIGWSNGAMNLLLLASERPDVLSSAIFVHGVARQEDMQDITARYPELFQKFEAFRQEMESQEIPEEEQNARVKQFDVDVWFPYMLADADAGSAILSETFKDAGFSWDHTLYTDKDPPSPFDVRDDLPKITARSLVIAGRHDMFPPERVEEMDTGIPNSSFVVFEESGHFAPVEEPELFVKSVLDFLEVKPSTD